MSNPFAEWLRRQLEERELGINQASTYMEAAGVRVSPSSLSAFVRGKTLPTYPTARRLAKYFGVPVQQLWRLVEEARFQMSEEEAPEVGSTEEPQLEIIKQIDRQHYIAPEVRQWLKRIVATEYRRWLEEQEARSE